MGWIRDVYFWRQSTVLITDCFLSTGTGFMLSFPAVLNPAILSPNSTDIRVTPEQASWIAASHGISGIIGFIIAPHLMQIMGRKSLHIVTNLIVGIGFLMFALANSVTTLYAARITQGLTVCSVYINTVILGEYAHPKRRGYFVTLKKVSVGIGSLMCHGMALCWTWRQIAGFAILPNLASLILTLIWRESPAFLALKGRYDECDKTYKWLYGDNIKSTKDVEELIATQKKTREQAKNKKKSKTFLRKLLKKDFLKPFLIVSLLTLIIDACGRYYMLAYIVQILIEITKDKSIATYCTLGADVLTIVAFLISSFVIRCCKRRTLLFSFGMTSTLLMFSTSIITYLTSRFDIDRSLYWLAPGVILLNVFLVNVGVVPACFTIVSEIFPLEHKGMGLCLTGIVFSSLYALVMKFTPLMMEKTGVEGTFGIYGLLVLISLLVLYFILNETKDKTLQEIENEIKGDIQLQLLNSKEVSQYC